MAIDMKYGQVLLERTPKSLAENEPVIVFRAQDKLALEVVKHYAELATAQCSPEHAALAQKTVDAFEAWPTKKLPD